MFCDNLDSRLQDYGFGYVKQYEISNEVEFHVWNSMGAAENNTNILELAITAKDTLDTDTGNLIANHCIEIKGNSPSDTWDYVQGSTKTHTLTNEGDGTKTIYGTANDGTAANSKNNYAVFKARINLNNSNAGPLQPGPQEFKIVAYGYYV